MIVIVGTVCFPSVDEDAEAGFLLRGRSSLELFIRSIVATSTTQPP